MLPKSPRIHYPFDDLLGNLYYEENWNLAQWRAIDFSGFGSSLSTYHVFARKIIWLLTWCLIHHHQEICFIIKNVGKGMMPASFTNIIWPFPRSWWSFRIERTSIKNKVWVKRQFLESLLYWGNSCSYLRTRKQKVELLFTEM